MAERERALHALAGRYFPRVGDDAEIRIGRAPGLRAPVVVTRISADGMNVTVRVLGRDGAVTFGAQRVLSRKGDGGSGLYGNAMAGQPNILAVYVQFE